MSSEPQHWDSELYQGSYSFVLRYGQDLLKVLDPKPDERIVDVGCGTGQLTADIAGSGAQVVGVDYSPDMIATARKNYPNLRFEVAEASRLPFADEFDAVFSNAVLHWVRDHLGATASIARALKPGGRFVFEMGGRGNIQQIWSAMVEALRAMGIQQPERLSPWYYASVGEYATLLESQGLEVRFATLFDRPTVLEGGEGGMASWLAMFGRFASDPLPAGRRTEFVERVEALARPKLFRDGVWTADYRRLRMVAAKPLVK
jgi:trans-aconitate methyltransferase